MYMVNGLLDIVYIMCPKWQQFSDSGKWAVLLARNAVHRQKLSISHQTLGFACLPRVSPWDQFHVVGMLQFVL